MIYKTCSKCRNKYEYGKKCSCLNRLNKEMQAINGEVDIFYTTPEWRKLRKRIILRDGAHCHRCLIKYNIITASNLEPHHIVARSVNKELELEPTNLVTVCKTCNLQLGTKGVDWDHKVIPLMEYSL
ncbi:HNH endonuclease [Peribacillus frigoritolerans]|uniref:HNH endonuclease n=1 Tax=Peribacillus frigoritolerans TaxID=450367 RepID=UPI0037F2BFB7